MVFNLHVRDLFRLYYGDAEACYLPMLMTSKKCTDPNRFKEFVKLETVSVKQPKIHCLNSSSL